MQRSRRSLRCVFVGQSFVLCMLLVVPLLDRRQAHRFIAKQADEKAPENLQSFQRHSLFALVSEAAACRHIKGLFSQSYDGIPTSLQDTLRKMLSVAPSSRPDILTFLTASYFNDVRALTSGVASFLGYRSPFARCASSTRSLTEMCKHALSFSRSALIPAAV